MADATDSKSVIRKDVWVQVPPPVLNFIYSFLQTQGSPQLASTALFVCFRLAISSA
jgi:hypothetical protein